MRTPPVITPEDFERFSEFFYKRTGIIFESSKRYFVDRRLVERIEATDCADFNSYMRLLRIDASGRETQILTNAMTVNETYFFREADQFSCMTDHLLGEIIRSKRPNRPIRILSIPCSTGEEAYSIVIHILENWPEIVKYDVEIYGADIDTNVLASAQRGIYSQRSLQGVSKETLNRYFKPQAGGFWRIGEELQESVSFVRSNVADRLEMSRFTNIDIVFCRNLLIYFDDLSRRMAAEAFYETMSPGGFICLGHSESMSRISSLFKVRTFGSTIVYQKPLNGEV